MDSSAHKNGHQPLYAGKDELPPSLNEAIDVPSCSPAPRRNARPGSPQHNARCSSM